MYIHRYIDIDIFKFTLSIQEETSSYPFIERFRNNGFLGVPTIAHWLNDPACVCGVAGSIPGQVQ